MTSFTAHAFPRVCLAMLLIVHLAIDILIPSFARNTIVHTYIVTGSLGFCGGQLLLLAAWGAFGWPAPWRRWLATIGLAALGGLALALGARYGSGGVRDGTLEHVTTALVSGSLYLACAVIVLFIGRWRRDWRIENNNSNARTKHWQFSLGAMLGAMTLCATLLAGTRWLLFPGGFEWYFSWFSLFLLCTGSWLLIMPMWPILWSMFSENSGGRARTIFLGLPYLGLLSLGQGALIEFYLSHRLKTSPNFDDMLFMVTLVFAFHVAQFAVVVVSLLCLQGLGYSLSNRRRET